MHDLTRTPSATCVFQWGEISCESAGEDHFLWCKQAERGCHSGQGSHERMPSENPFLAKTCQNSRLEQSNAQLDKVPANQRPSGTCENCNRMSEKWMPTHCQSFLKSHKHTWIEEKITILFWMVLVKPTGSKKSLRKMLTWNCVFLLQQIFPCQTEESSLNWWLALMRTWMTSNDRGFFPGKEKKKPKNQRKVSAFRHTGLAARSSRRQAVFRPDMLQRQKSTRNLNLFLWVSCHCRSQKWQEPSAVIKPLSISTARIWSLTYEKFLICDKFLPTDDDKIVPTPTATDAARSFSHWLSFLTFRSMPSQTLYTLHVP